MKSSLKQLFTDYHGLAFSLRDNVYNCFKPARTFYWQRAKIFDAFLTAKKIYLDASV